MSIFCVNIGLRFTSQSHFPPFSPWWVCWTWDWMYKCYISWRLAVCTRYFYKFIGEHDDQFFINKNVKSLLSVVPRLPILRYPQQQLGRLQPSIDICCPRPSSAANQSHVAAAVDRQDKHTDGQRTDTRPWQRPCTAYYAGSAVRQRQ